MLQACMYVHAALVGRSLPSELLLKDNDGVQRASHQRTEVSAMAGLPQQDHLLHRRHRLDCQALPPALLQLEAAALLPRRPPWLRRCLIRLPAHHHHCRAFRIHSCPPVHSPPSLYRMAACLIRTTHLQQGMIQIQVPGHRCQDHSEAGPSRKAA